MLFLPVSYEFRSVNELLCNETNSMIENYAEYPLGMCQSLSSNLRLTPDR